MNIKSYIKLILAHINLRGLYKKEKIIFYFTLFYIVLFTLLAFSKGNREFIFYSITMLLLLEFGIYVHKQVRLPELIVIGLSSLGLLHILGGNLQFHGGRLYDTFILFGVFRYDNIIHIFGTMMGTFVLNTLFFHYSYEQSNIRLGLYYFALILMALGVGVFNEIIELIAVVFLNASDAVGNYLNNAIDLIFNLIGSLAAIIIIDTYRLHKKNQ